MDAVVVNGWTLFAHEYFEARFLDLLAQVEKLALKDPEGFIDHELYKLFEKVDDAVRQRVPANPQHKDFRIGQMLGSKTGHWRRVKSGLPQRYRLFFQFRSAAPKSIIYCWLNDQATFREEGSRTDVYAVFKSMIDSGRMPNSFDELRGIARGLPATA